MQKNQASNSMTTNSPANQSNSMTSNAVTSYSNSSANIVPTQLLSRFNKLAIDTTDTQPINRNNNFKANSDSMIPMYYSYLDSCSGNSSPVHSYSNNSSPVHSYSNRWSTPSFRYSSPSNISSSDMSYSWCFQSEENNKKELDENGFIVTNDFPAVYHKASTYRKKFKTPVQNGKIKNYTSKTYRNNNYKKKMRISKNHKRLSKKRSLSNNTVDSPVKSLGSDETEIRSTNGDRLRVDGNKMRSNDGKMRSIGDKTNKSTKSDIIANRKSAKKYVKSLRRNFNKVKCDDIREEEYAIEEDVFQEKVDDAVSFVGDFINHIINDVSTGAIMHVGTIDTISDSKNQETTENKCSDDSHRREISIIESKHYVSRNNSVCEDGYDTIEPIELADLNMEATDLAASVKSEQVKSEQVKSEQVKSEQVKSEQVKSEQTKPSKKYTVDSVKFEDTDEYADYDMINDVDLNNIMCMVNTTTN